MVPQKPIGLANFLSNQDFLVFSQSWVLSFEHTAIKWLIPELQAVPAFQWSPSYGALTSDFFNDFFGHDGLYWKGRIAHSSTDISQKQHKQEYYNSNATFSGQ